MPTERVVHRLAAPYPQVSQVGFEASIRDAPPSLREVAIAVRNLEVSLRLLRQRFANKLGLSTAEYTAVMMISQWGDVTPKELATELNMTPGAITTLLDRLTALDFVYRRPHPDDRRRVHIALSDRAIGIKYDLYRQYFNAVSRAASKNESLSSPETVAAIITLSESIDGSALPET